MGQGEPLRADVPTSIVSQGPSMAPVPCQPPDAVQAGRGLSGQGKKVTPALLCLALGHLSPSQGGMAQV